MEEWYEQQQAIDAPKELKQPLQKEKAVTYAVTEDSPFYADSSVNT